MNNDFEIWTLSTSHVLHNIFQLKNLAFGKSNPKAKKNQKTSSVNVNEKQWEDWKKNDEEVKQ